MLILKQLDLIARIHKRVMQGCTGTPSEFASYLGISERYLYEVIDVIKSMGAPIRYSRTMLSYYYTEEVRVMISCSFVKVLQEEREDKQTESPV